MVIKMLINYKINLKRELVLKQFTETFFYEN